ncbi:uncharacterized protein BCR38DRAFT_412735 [Pseudomassariella vexata]|uniref:MARVEL domain-containing protein n=1 Tax=Pseudomassariella vexata TaxID=1141098 RepID=A0A1Y2DKD7_9PEZI|nr:uncharacterized protein BCR38DRAFT_412735 [Pseudomassariella vexata]ORY59740.1 hypothetical protein BCR38DRAFT_412735 [Pseudomassariella vexata]
MSGPRNRKIGRKGYAKIRRYCLEPYLRSIFAPEAPIRKSVAPIMVFLRPDYSRDQQRRYDIENHDSEPSSSKGQKKPLPSKPNSPSIPKSSYTSHTWRPLPETPGPGQRQKLVSQPTAKSRKMSTINKKNVWSSVAVDKDRSHISAMTMKEFGIRIAQGTLAILFLVLTSFSAFTLNAGNLSGFSLSFFVFSLTVTYFVLYGVAVLAYPIIYHWIAQIVFEAFLVVFWLAAWATLASYASALNLGGAGRTSRASLGTMPASGLGRRGGQESLREAIMMAISDMNPASTLEQVSTSSVEAAETIIGISAALGAVIWVLFIITMIMTDNIHMQE